MAAQQAAGGSSSDSAAADIPAAGAAEAIADEMLSDLEAVAAAGSMSDLGRALNVERVVAAVLADRAVPLADPGRLFGRIIALLDESSPRWAAALASTVLATIVLLGSSHRAQAAAFAGELLPALICDCAREGSTDSASALHLLMRDNAPLAARARRLGALDALLRRAAAWTPDTSAGERVESSLYAIAELTQGAAHADDGLRAFVQVPRVLEEVVRWLRREGNTIERRAAAAQLLGRIMTTEAALGNAAAAIHTVLLHPGMLAGVADAVADAASFGPKQHVDLAFAAGMIAGAAGAAQLASMADTPGFLDGVAALLAARRAPLQGPTTLAKFCASEVYLATLLVKLTTWPSRRLLAARPRFVAALGVRMREVVAAVSAALAAAAGDQTQRPPPDELLQVTTAFGVARNILLELDERSLVDGGGGGGGDSGLPAVGAPATAGAAAPEPSRSAGGAGGGPGPSNSNSSAAAASSLAPFASASRAGASAAPAFEPASAPPEAESRRCFACGRKDGVSGAPLLQCAGCEGTGLKAFFCNRACLKAGWKAHKPACVAARRRSSGGGSGGSGGGGGGAS